MTGEGGLPNEESSMRARNDAISRSTAPPHPHGLFHQHLKAELIRAGC
jgi:hypothetical protein